MASQSDVTYLHLKESLHDRETEIELLQETFSEIGSELDLDTVFQIVAQRARDLINAETVLVPILDENCETYTYRGGAGLNAEEIVGESLPLEFGVCGWVWRHKKPWWRGVLDELSEDERNLWEKEVGNMILVPLQGKRHFLGGIAGLNKLSEPEFTKRDLTLLTMFASIVAIAIENAMAVEKYEAAKLINEEYQHQLEILNKQLLESNQELEFLSLYDTVTLLPNRTLFRDRLSQQLSLSSTRGNHCGIILIDLNEFKQLNDSLGHDAGDQVLRIIAERLSDYIGSEDTLARPGGDEFVFLFPGCDVKAMSHHAKKIQALLEEHFQIGASEIAISGSLGIALYPEHGETVGELMRHADTAMYHAKSTRQGYSIYNPDTDDASLGKLTLQADLRKALEQKSFELYYQPQISLDTNQVVAVEALGRWTHNVKGPISPNVFIPYLEQCGLIDKYTYWALEQAVNDSKLLRQSGYNIKVAVNISTQTFTNKHFIRDVEKIVGDEETGRSLIFEITENLFLSEYERLSGILEQICKMGIILSIDDFGTGYSSLRRLKKLPVSELKIDKSFIKDMTTSIDDASIVKSTIEMAHNLGLTVVAEGVETEKVKNQLKCLDCDIVQGYLFSRPVPFSDLQVFLKK